MKFFGLVDNGDDIKGKYRQHSADIWNRNIRIKILVPKKGQRALPATGFSK